MTQESLQTLQTFMMNAAMQVIVFAIGLYGYRRLSDFGRIMWWLICISLVNYFIGQSFKFKEGNQLFYNIYMLFEVLFLLTAAFKYHTEAPKRWFWQFLILVAVAFSVQWIVLQVTGFANYLATFSGLFLLIVYLYLLYLTFDRYRDRKDVISARWIILGIVIFMACILPLMSSINMIIEEDQEEAKLLFEVIIGASSNVRYLFLAIGLSLMIKSSITQEKLSHG